MSHTKGESFIMNTTKKTIFLVDDDITNLTIGNNVLEKYYNVVTLNSGRRLIKMLERHRPDMILLDVDMPEMNGYETITLIKQNEATKNIPVIFLTAKTNSEFELEGLSLGAIDYITKPFSPPLLLKRLEVHLLVESQKSELINFNTNLQGMVQEQTATVLELQYAVLKTMAVLVDSRDAFTGGHIDRTQAYLRILLEGVRESGRYDKEIADWDIELILQSSLLHDVGKIAIEDSILRKPGRLTPDEFESIKVHTSFGEKVIESIKANTTQHTFLECARIMAISHHEKWNGSGYPNKLAGTDIPLLGRVLAIADVYDALVSERPYKKPFSHAQSLNIIQEDSGKHFDPGLVEIFLGCNRSFETLSKRFLTPETA